MAYAAYLRIYEPVSAFHEPDRSRWAAYAASSTRPRRRDSLVVEHAEALRRAITTPWVAVPERESEHAYVRCVDGTTYVCPWQTRLRCLLAYGQMRSRSGTVLACEGSAGEGLAGEGPAGEKLAADGDPALAALARLGEAGPARPHIVASSWTVPLTWFVPFAVELDYGGLVHLVSDDALCGDQSVAEIRAGIDGAARGECELAVAMYMRARDRWRAFAEFEQAN